MSAIWQPAASLPALYKRGELLAAIRAFFAARSVLEVETPALSHFGTTDPALESFRTVYCGPGAAQGEVLYLHTSPEFPMKRLLAAGTGSIYQICKVFRNGEQGRLHNCEFTLLEWYRVGFDHFALMEELEALVHELLCDRAELPVRSVRLTYAEAFQAHLGINPHLADSESLRAAARACQLEPPVGLGQDRDAWLDLLFSHCVQCALPPFCFVYDYPASQAALARIRPGSPPVAERFELFIDGMELANGFHELTDGLEQAQRLARDQVERERRGLAPIPLDEAFLAALRAGLPPCAGVAVGLDRLLMIALGVQSLHEVLAFPTDRA